MYMYMHQRFFFSSLPLCLLHLFFSLSLSVSFCLFVSLCLSLSLFVSLSLSFSLFLSFCLFLSLSRSLSLSFSLSLSLALSLSLSLCLLSLFPLLRGKSPRKDVLWVHEEDGYHPPGGECAVSQKLVGTGSVKHHTKSWLCVPLHTFNASPQDFQRVLEGHRQEEGRPGVSGMRRPRREGRGRAHGAAGLANALSSGFSGSSGGFSGPAHPQLGRTLRPMIQQMWLGSDCSLSSPWQIHTLIPRIKVRIGWPCAMNTARSVSVSVV